MILHLMHNEKFIGPYIDFLKENFKSDFLNHFFIVVGRGKKDKFTIPEYDNILYLKYGYNKTWNYFKLFKLYNKYAKNADKIIVHSFIRNWNLYYFYFNKRLLLKSYWIIWGNDLYRYNKERTTFKDKINHYIRSKIYSNIGNVVATTKGNYRLAKEWYGVKGRFFKCINYTSNLYKEYNLKPRQNNNINIQLGNSADPSNNHIDVLKQLSHYRDKDIKIFVPLSYGSRDYANEVIKFGRNLFGKKFIPLVEYVTFDKYLDFLNNINIAIFAHNRQQGMGNITTLLGLGKKVYMNKDLTSSKELKDMSIKIFNLDDINLEVNFEESENNKRIIKEIFSVQNLRKDWNKIFTS